jgi:hypothetical protein
MIPSEIVQRDGVRVEEDNSSFEVLSAASLFNAAIFWTTRCKAPTAPVVGKPEAPHCASKKKKSTGGKEGFLGDFRNCMTPPGQEVQRIVNAQQAAVITHLVASDACSWQSCRT